MKKTLIGALILSLFTVACGDGDKSYSPTAPSAPIPVTTTTTAPPTVTSFAGTWDGAGRIASCSGDCQGLPIGQNSHLRFVFNQSGNTVMGTVSMGTLIVSGFNGVAGGNTLQGSVPRTTQTDAWLEVPSLIVSLNAGSLNGTMRFWFRPKLSLEGTSITFDSLNLKRIG